MSSIESGILTTKMSSRMTRQSERKMSSLQSLSCAKGRFVQMIWGFQRNRRNGDSNERINIFSGIVTFTDEGTCRTMATLVQTYDPNADGMTSEKGCM